MISSLFYCTPCLSSPQIQVLVSGLLKAGKKLAFSVTGASKENN